MVIVKEAPMAENIYDKGYRRMLSDKRNFRDFVKSRTAAPWAEKLDADSLERIDTKHITKDFKDRDSDIVYRARIEDSDVVFFVLLELQSEPDFTMPFRLLVYMTELLRRTFAEADEKARERKDFKLPAVVPIVLYNGSGGWNCAESFGEYVKGHEMFVPNIIDFRYILIDVNETDEEELLRTPTLVNLAMLADRKDDPERVLRRLGKVLELSRRLTEDEKLQLKDWIFDVILKKAKNRLTDDTIERIKKTFEREEVSEMTYAIERAIDEIEQRGIRKGMIEGERKGMLKMALAMLDEGLSIETAAKYSGISADELKKSMGSRKPQ
jgi:predicted transposase/invertase (TIGR01784 family)